MPGGGIEADETYVDAAIRELGEETGIVATARQVGAPTWQRHATFRYRGERRLQHEVVVPILLATPAPAVDGALRVGYEEEDYFADHWWWWTRSLAVPRLLPAPARRAHRPLSRGRDDRRAV